MDFKSILGTIFDDLFKIFSKKRRQHDSIEKLWKINDFAPTKPPFSNQNSIEFSSFFDHPFLNIIFPTFDTSWCQNARFWDTLGAQRCPKWHPKWPKWRQNAPPKTQVVHQNTFPGTDLLPRSLSERSWASFWLIWDGVLINFEGFWHQFGSNLDNFGDNFADHWSRMPRIEKPNPWSEIRFSTPSTPCTNVFIGIVHFPQLSQPLGLISRKCVYWHPSYTSAY